MKTKAILLSATFCLGVVMLGCGEDKEEEKKDDKKSEKVEASTETIQKTDPKAAKATAELNIEGMTCPMGCAKFIENKVGESKGVAECTVDFDNKLAHIQFDDSQTSENELTALIEGLNDGQFKVGEGETEEIEMIDSTKEIEEAPTKDSEEVEETVTTEEADVSFNFIEKTNARKGGYTASGPASFSMPNLAYMFSNMF